MSFLEELLVFLKKEQEALESLKELTYEKTDVIIDNNIEALEGTIKEEERLINLLANIEEARIKFLDSWGMDKNISLTEIIDKTLEGKDELMEIALKLSRALEEIHSRNNTNRQLINENLQWLDFNMNLLTNIRPPATYGKKKKVRGSKNSVFDRKV